MVEETVKNIRMLGRNLPVNSIHCTRMIPRLIILVMTIFDLSNKLPFIMTSLNFYTENQILYQRKID